jgi:pyruvate formate lyase activating enzyme
MTTLAMRLDSMTVDGEMFEHLPDRAVRCFACAHRCFIKEGRRGICKVRFNQAGELRVPWGYVSGLQSDPIEKKPFYHFLPGSDALTFGMLGCDFHCAYCQNWMTSQALRDADAGLSGRTLRRMQPGELSAYGLQSGSRIVASSYNEPLITSEWALAVFREARQAGLRTAFISNGNATPEVLGYLRPFVDGYKIDLKTMNDKNYRQLGGVLEHVLESIRITHQLGFWVEIVTLVVPGFNDSTDELMDAARYLVSISPDIPWHVTAFHPDYKMTDPDNTSAKTLIRAAEIGYEAGLNYVYAGNLSGRVGPYEHTICPDCGKNLIERSGFSILKYAISGDGNCSFCGKQIAGIWTAEPSEVRTDELQDRWPRHPKQIL